MKKLQQLRRISLPSVTRRLSTGTSNSAGASSDGAPDANGVAVLSEAQRPPALFTGEDDTSTATASAGHDDHLTADDVPTVPLSGAAAGDDATTPTAPEWAISPVVTSSSDVPATSALGLERHADVDGVSDPGEPPRRL